jgi:UDP-N-acetylmuramoyl-tripeptide--D-alanyl-D-alanine ligase
MGARGPGHISHLARIAPPKIGAVLNIGTAHVGKFGSQEAIAAAKGELVEALPADGVAVLNADDPLVRAMAERAQAGILWFGTGPSADVRAQNVRLDDTGRVCFTLHHEGDQAPLVLGVVGEHHLPNALAAASIALAAGVPFDIVAQALSGATLLSGSRMEVTERPDGITIINDAFNASPESVRAALDSLARMTADTRPSIAVLGDMRELGEAAPALHEEIGRKAAQLGIGRLITVGGPNAEVMAKAAQQAGVTTDHVTDKSQIIPLLEGDLKDRAVVLIKGANSARLFDTAADLASRC